MNSVTLRVSSTKSGTVNSKKNSDIRAALVILPKNYNDSEKFYCLEFKNAQSIPDQVNAVKNVQKILGEDVEAFQFLADLYFHSPLKHPVRNQILKLLITAVRLGSEHYDDTLIINALAAAQLRLVEETKTDTESVKWNETVCSLTGCFENFPCGLEALKQNSLVIFPFLCASLHKYLTELGVLSSPSVRNQYYNYVHNSLRLVLSCVQEFPDKLKSSHATHLQQLNTICKEIINDSEMPLDTRTNAGILMAHNAKLFNEFESFIQTVKLIKNPNEIVLCVGVISTFDQQDFKCISTDIRDICSKIDEIANNHATSPNILLCAARALYQISKVILGFNLSHPQAITDDVKLILRKLLIFSFCYLEHHMDIVRHLCRDLLRNIVAGAKKTNFEFLLQKIYDACNSERLSLSMKCVVLQQSAAILGANEIIEKCPELFTELFAHNLGRDFIVNNLYEMLMSVSHKEIEYESWYKLWIEYLLSICAEDDERLPDIEILIVKAVKCDCRIVNPILENSENNIPISTRLSALWAVRKAGLKLDNFNAIMQNFSQYLLFSILSNCDETRLMALRLLVETHKTTELLTPLECGHLLTYLEYNSNCQSPATRQKTLSLLGKALIRCELNLMKTLKDSKTKTDQNKPIQLVFLLSFMRILVANLFHGANFSRRSISLQLLKQCVGICITCNLDLIQVLPPNTIESLAEMIGDSFEANKDLAVQILRLIENRLDCSLIVEYKLNQLNVDEILKLLISVRPTDSVTAAYQLEFFCNRGDCTQFGECEETSFNPNQFAALRWLLSQLKKGLHLAQQSILEAAKYNPLYGLLFAIKHLLKVVDFQLLAQELPWRNFIAEMIIVCKELTMIVGPVVNSSSPEGHLPNDFSELPEEYQQFETLDDGQAKSAEDCRILSPKNTKPNLANVKTTPQMVLLCAWRTVKEVSLILGDIVLRSPIQFSKGNEHFLVTKEQILDIGDHFKQMLAETKHRGAFEQAYVGFSKLCCRLWCVEVLDLNSLPMQWLRELITLISKDEQINEKICATRRSAGVPFMVQALITSELQVGSTKSLFYCMSHLFQLCASTVDRSAESRTHALNILRALFRCTDLNEAVGEFVSDGIMCALRGYDAVTWSEKNSATLLFASLMTRIFGVQRTRDTDNLSIRNKMTGRIFFLRYPKLYDFFLEQLQEACVLVKQQQQQKAHKLHPLLLILSRLYPSALEGTESNLKLSAFVPYIDVCAGCVQLQTRYLAAKAMVALIPKDAFNEAILKKCALIMFEAIETPDQIHLNTLHGRLLQILLLLKVHKDIDDGLITDIALPLATVYKVMPIHNAVILKVILDILIEILSSLTSLTCAHETIQNLLYFSTNVELGEQFDYIYPVVRRSFFIYSLHTLRLTLPFGAISDYLLSPPLLEESVHVEQTETCLNIILLLLHRMNDWNLREVVSEFEIPMMELQFVNLLDEETLIGVGKELCESKALHFTLKMLIHQPRYYPECAGKAYAILSLLDIFDFTLNHLIKESKKLPGDVKMPLTLCVRRFVAEHNWEYKTSHTCLEYLVDIAQPWQPDSLRSKAPEILSFIAGHYPRALEKKKLTFVRMYISLVLSLLMDDDFYIRDSTAKMVICQLPDNIEMENIVNTMAQRLFLQATADILMAMKSDETYILEIFKMITEILSVQNSKSDDNSSDGGSSMGGDSQNGGNVSEVEVFDKNEANIFAEPIKAITDAKVVFKSTFSGNKKLISFISSYQVP